MYSFKFFVIFFQLLKIQIGKINVVKIINNKPIPSIPKIKFIFKEDSHSTLVTNWNVETKESKPIHKKAVDRKVNKEKFKAIFRIKIISPLGINNIIKEPNKGKKNQ